MTNADKFAIIAREIEAVRAARPAAGYLNGAGYAAGAPAFNGGTPSSSRREACQCGGTHSFHPSDDSDVEGLFAESALRQPDEGDEDYSVSNGHVPGNGYASIFRAETHAAQAVCGMGKGRPDMDSWEGSGRPLAIPRAYSVGAAAVGAIDSEVAGNGMAPHRWLTALIDRLAPDKPSKLLWTAVLIGLVLWGLGVI